MAVIKTPLRDLSTVWERIWQKEPVHFPFYSYAWHTLWLELFGSDYNSFYLLVNDEYIAPFIEKNKILYFSGGKEIADYLDIIGPRKKKENAWNEILQYCKEQDISKLLLFNIPEQSATLTVFNTMNNAIVTKEDTTPTVLLPPTWDEYTANLSRKHRHELRRKIRKFERDYPNTHISISKDSCQDITHLLQLMKHNEDKRSFLTEAMTQFFIMLPERFPNSLRIFILRQNENIIAMKLIFVTDNTMLLYNSGQDYSYTGAGFYLAAKGIEYAIENNYTTYNFLQGDERYKYELGGKDHLVYNVTYSLQH